MRGVLQSTARPPRRCLPSPDFQEWRADAVPNSSWPSPPLLEWGGGRPHLSPVRHNLARGCVDVDIDSDLLDNQAHRDLGDVGARRAK
eukprot:4951260-Pyramimonas_sp.AAC.1